MPEVDVCGEVQFADDNVPVRFVLDTARQRSESRADVRDTRYFFQLYSDHLPEEPTGIDDERQPFFPVLAIVAPVRQILMDGVENANGGWTSPSIVEIRTS